MNKTIFGTGIVVIIVAGLAYAVWAGAMHLPGSVGDKSPNTNETGTICTMDARQCPDGSWVGRTGPNCEFVCPNSTSTSTSQNEVTLDAKLTQQVSGLGVQITPLEVVQDSRCPTNVQCIQAGTVQVKAQLVSGLGTATQTFTLGKSVTTEAETITLIAVTPAKVSTTTILPADYRFTFKIAKR